MSMRDDLHPTTLVPLAARAFSGGACPLESDRAADVIRACEVLGIPIKLPAPPRPPALDQKSANELLRDVHEYLREVFGSRLGRTPGCVPVPRVRPTADRRAIPIRDVA